jgi:heme-degrading monooxygenase HmoA
MGRIASFHLVRESTWRAPLAMGRLGTDRFGLGRTTGLRFWKLLGTGHADRTNTGIDTRRTALFAVWDSEQALDDFLATSTIGRRWNELDEAWHVRLRSLGGHGRWRGVDPLDGLDAGDADGRVAVLTRADVRIGAWGSFRRAGRTVDHELHRAPGLIDVVGIGEAPVGRLATFSLWESLDAARTFAYSTPEHVDVVRRTRDERWYGEELFARFEPYGSSGRWNGRDPLDPSVRPGTGPE